MIRGHGEHSAGEVRSLGADVERAHATLVGRVGGANPRAWQHCRGGPRHGPVADPDRSRPVGTAVGHPVGPGPCAPARRRPQAAHRHRRDAAVGPQCPARAGHRRGAGRQPLAMDVEERPQVGGRVARLGPFGESSPRQRPVAQAQGQPVTSVDTKKKELIVPFKNRGGPGVRRAIPSNAATCTTGQGMQTADFQCESRPPSKRRIL